MSFPRPPSSAIDWNNPDPSKIEFGRGHVEATFDTQVATWTKPRWVDSPYLSIHGLATCLNYGQQVFEGLKAFRGPNDEVYIFRPQDHARRMARSSAAVSMPELSEDLFLNCVRMAVAGNTEFLAPHGSPLSLYIRPVLIGSGPQIAPSPPQTFTFAVFVCPIPAYLGRIGLDALVLDDFDRAAPKGTGAVKVGGNYAPVMRWSEQARKQGYGVTLHLDSLTHTEIDEFSTSAFVGILRDTQNQPTLVVTDSKNVVESFTSDSCVVLARQLGWKVEKRRIMYSELSEFVEVFTAGTAAALVPIRSITRSSTGDKFVFKLDTAEDSYCATLCKMLEDVQQGKVEDKLGWRYRVQLTVDDELKQAIPLSKDRLYRWRMPAIQLIAVITGLLMLRWKGQGL